MEIEVVGYIKGQCAHCNSINVLANLKISKLHTEGFDLLCNACALKLYDFNVKKHKPVIDNYECQCGGQMEKKQAAEEIGYIMLIWKCNKCGWQKHKSYLREYIMGGNNA